VAAEKIPDPSKAFTTARKLSVLVVSRTALLPVSFAALLPLAMAGTTKLPVKEILGIAKRFLLL
jgi:hypothetical protein